MDGQNLLHLTPSTEGIAQAASLLAQGRLVAFPTETVYGLGADARDGRAVAAIYEAKGRPSFNPLIVHLPDAETARSYGLWSDTAETLANAFWPGPLSLVLPLRDGHGLSSLVTAGLDSVALRVPAHPAAQSLLRAFGGPVAAPSANPSGRISPTTAAHVREGLADNLAAILDAGGCSVGLESTIVGLIETPRMLRPGGVSREDIDAVLSVPLLDATDGTISAPGQLLSHYAPRAAVRLDVRVPASDEVFLGFGDMPCDLNLSPAADLHEAAAQLFDQLHKLDATGKPIAVSPIPAYGLGVAINDRLKRAAAPR
ncbi:MAG: L-threonylcarbamoyladenylate synthase [Roseobacter sp.]